MPSLHCAAGVARAVNDLAHDLAHGGAPPLRLLLKPRPDVGFDSDAYWCFHGAIV
jgi:hypothetical protein